MRCLVVVLVVVLLLGPGSAVAQSRALASLSGLVYDQASGQPLIDVHVFLDQTMRGAVTDREGRFRLPSISPGAYTLVVSMIGFEVARRQLTLSAGEQGAYRFGLKEAIIPLPEGLVTAEHPRLWRKRLKRFKHLFFGETQNASSCELLNPEVLDFEEDKESGRFTARASEPLRIVNRALVQLHRTCWGIAFGSPRVRRAESGERGAGSGERGAFSPSLPALRPPFSDGARERNVR